MSGAVVIIHPDGSGRVYRVRKGPSLRRLQKIVGGYIETVPYWQHVMDERGKRVPALVFCNEDGKRLGLPLNELATRMWRAKTGFGGDVLVGNVVAIVGSVEWLKAWDDQQ